MEKTINDFSMLCRLFGNLFYRAPTDPILQGVFTWLQQQGLSQNWALTTDEQGNKALQALAQVWDSAVLQQDYQHLQSAVNFSQSFYQNKLAEFIQFRQERGMPTIEQPDHIAILLLTASWIEDNLDSLSAQQQLFEQFLLPCMSKFLGQIEAHANTAFYRALARLTREALSAMADEIEESLVE